MNLSTMLREQAQSYIDSIREHGLDPSFLESAAKFATNTEKYGGYGDDVRKALEEAGMDFSKDYYVLYDEDCTPTLYESMAFLRSVADLPYEIKKDGKRCVLRSIEKFEDMEDIYGHKHWVIWVTDGENQHLFRTGTFGNLLERNDQGELVLEAWTADLQNRPERCEYGRPLYKRLVDTIHDYHSRNVFVRNYDSISSRVTEEYATDSDEYQFICEELNAAGYDSLRRENGLWKLPL